MLYLEGKNVVLEALRSGRSLVEIVLYDGVKKDPKMGEILKLARKARTRVRRMGRKDILKMSKTGVPQGVIAVAWEEGPASLQEILTLCREQMRDPFILVITDVQSEQNLGAILRSAEGAGVDAVVLPPKSKGITAVVARTSMGASEYVPVVSESLFSALRRLRDEGFLIVGADASATKNYFEIALTGPVALIIGGEDRGLSDPVKADCEVLARIPLQGKLNSLNMSVSAGVVMFERVRQLTTGKKEA